MCGIVLAGERLREVRITLPDRRPVPVGETRIADRIRAVIAGDAAARQGIAEGVDDRLRFRASIPDEVAALARAAPGAVRIPMPCFGMQLGVLPVGDRLPAGRHDALERLGGKELVGRAVRQTVDTRTEGLGGPYRIPQVLGRRIHADGLRHARRAPRHERRAQRRIPHREPLPAPGACAPARVITGRRDNSADRCCRNVILPASCGFR
jgi:hypothetical protein